MSGWRHAAAGGAAGSVAVALFTGWLRRLGATRVDYGRMMGAALGTGRRARRAGEALFLANGPLLACGYDVAFRLLGLRPSAATGALLGAGHGLVALAGIAAAPRLHPRPGRAGLQALSWDEGSTASTVVAGHVLFGAIVGATVGLRRPERPGPAGFAERPAHARIA